MILTLAEVNVTQVSLTQPYWLKFIPARLLSCMARIELKIVAGQATLS
jgi:hypothetical protein